MRDLRAPNVRHFFSAVGLLFCLVATANAYSIVMRGGKRIEIPDQFHVTPLTLTYETAPGFWVTLQMAAIDIPATEQANNEKPGSLLRRAAQPRVIQESAEKSGSSVESKATRTITNRDLESFGRQRQASERAYEQRLKDMGLPSLAEVRAQAAESAERFWQEMARKRAEAEANERISQLQTEVAVLNVQLSQLQNTVEQRPIYSPDGFVVFGGFPFFDSFGRSKVNRSLFRVAPGVPIGGAFGTLHVPFFRHFEGARRQIFVAPGTSVRGRMGYGRGPGGRRSH